MKPDIFRELYRIVRVVAARRPRGSRRMPDALVVLVVLYAAISEAPISWAVARRNWPVWCLRHLAVLPSSTTISRRSRRAGVLAFIADVLDEAQRDLPDTLWRMIDGKPLPIGGASGDRQARCGRAVRGKARGYKAHFLLNSLGKIVQWTVTPMSTPEQDMAARMVRRADELAPGYVVCDANYDSNQLCGIARTRGVQVVTPRRRPGTGLGRGKNRHDPARLRSVQMTEGPSDFGRGLLHDRAMIERRFGNMTGFGGGLGPLPAWVRTHRRVHRWVAAKLAIDAVRAMLLRRKAAAVRAAADG